MIAKIHSKNPVFEIIAQYVQCWVSKRAEFNPLRLLYDNWIIQYLKNEYTPVYV